jgi:histidinol dehydrogenase
VIKTIQVKNGTREATQIRCLNRLPDKSIIVEKIIDDVIKFGDIALTKYTKKYDKVKIDSIVVDKEELKQADQQVT